MDTTNGNVVDAKPIFLFLPFKVATASACRACTRSFGGKVTCTTSRCYDPAVPKKAKYTPTP